MTRWTSPFHGNLRSVNFSRSHISGPLTDRKIEKYRKLGRYTAEYREARRVAMEKKGMLKRMGGFIELEPGRFIYSPL